MTMNCVLSEIDRIYRATRTTFASSKAASTSSITKNGVGCTFKIAKYRAMATNYTYLTSQRDDVEQAKGELQGIIDAITREMTAIFAHRSASSSASLLSLSRWPMAVRSCSRWSRASCKAFSISFFSWACIRRDAASSVRRPISSSCSRMWDNRAQRETVQNEIAAKEAEAAALRRDAREKLAGQSGAFLPCRRYSISAPGGWFPVPLPAAHHCSP